MNTTTDNHTPESSSTAPAPEPAPEGNLRNTALTISGVLGIADALTDAEQAELIGSETVITMGWYTFVDVGLAFAKIRDGRLYRVDFQNFEAYCRAKWHMEGTTLTA